jgi:hypothetical protein
MLTDCRAKTCEVDEMAQGCVHFQALLIVVMNLSQFILGHISSNKGKHEKSCASP